MNVESRNRRPPLSGWQASEAYGDPAVPHGLVVTRSRSPIVSRPRRLRRRKPTGFLPLFWSVAAVLACYTVFTMSDRPWTFTLAGLTIAISALLPGWLWCHGSAKGLPIYPVFSATFVMTSA